MTTMVEEKTRFPHRISPGNALPDDAGIAREALMAATRFTGRLTFRPEDREDVAQVAAIRALQAVQKDPALPILRAVSMQVAYVAREFWASINDEGAPTSLDALLEESGADAVPCESPWEPASERRENDDLPAHPDMVGRYTRADRLDAAVVFAMANVPNGEMIGTATDVHAWRDGLPTASGMARALGEDVPQGRALQTYRDSIVRAFRVAREVVAPMVNAATSARTRRWRPFRMVWAPVTRGGVTTAPVAPEHPGGRYGNRPTRTRWTAVGDVVHTRPDGRMWRESHHVATLITPDEARAVLASNVVTERRWAVQS